MKKKIGLITNREAYFAFLRKFSKEKIHGIFDFSMKAVSEILCQECLISVCFEDSRELTKEQLAFFNEGKFKKIEN